MVRAGGEATRPIIPSNGNPTGKLRVRVYPRVGSGRVAEMLDPHTSTGDTGLDFYRAALCVSMWSLLPPSVRIRLFICPSV